MKILRRLAVLVLSLCVSLGVLTGCVGTGGGDSINPEPIDQTKSQLNVFNFNGGFGNDWLYAARSRFEEMYKDTEFERGKKGVQIRITAEKANGATWEKDLPNSNQEVIFAEVVNYKEFVAKGLILDITDIVKENLNEKYGENKAIKDKLTPQQVAYYKHNGKYYGIPHYASYFGITYDIELFDEELLYFAQTSHGDSSAGRFAQSLTETRSAGPDGKPGTNDDGLPATYADFFVLCDYMYSLGIKPLTFAGNVRDKYLPALALSLAADYEGLTQFQLAYTFSGTAENLVSSFDGANPVVANKEVRIDSSNGYEVFAQSGRYYGLSFLEKIVKNDKYVYNVQRNYNNTYTHINAQKDYIGSKKKSGQRIAMLIDGCFWESEATEEFDKLGQQYPSDMGKMQRRFGFMPLPKATSDKVYDGNKITLLDYINSLAFMDSRNQMLCGYYAFEDGNQAYARHNLELISKSLRPDGLLAICAPSGKDVPIPLFSLVYVLQVYEYIWHTCDGSVLDEVGATVDAIMRTFASRAEAELPNAYFKVATSYIFHQKHIS